VALRSLLVGFPGLLVALRCLLVGLVSRPSLLVGFPGLLVAHVVVLACWSTGSAVH
jgi:hypothetical protein